MPCPPHRPTASRPAARKPSAMRSRAWSQLTTSQLSLPRVLRIMGYRIRRGLPMISPAAWPRTQRKPRLSGFSLSPLISTSRSPATVTCIPQNVGWQFMGHMVRTVRDSSVPISVIDVT